MKKKSKYVIIGITLLFILLSLKLFNDYRERELADLINYKSTDFQSIGVVMDLNKVEEDKAYEWFAKEKEPADEIIDFLAQYRVKKISQKEFIRSLNKGEALEFNINHFKSNAVMGRVHENNIHILVGNYYKVINGPIDMDGLREYNEKYKLRFAE